MKQIIDALEAYARAYHEAMTQATPVAISNAEVVRDRSVAALAAAREQQPVGWRMVPVEPTRAMDEAGYETLPHNLKHFGYQLFRDYYRAMLNAAPPAPSEQQPKETLAARLKRKGHAEAPRGTGVEEFSRAILPGDIPPAPSVREQQPVAWRDHVEERLLQWAFHNDDGDGVGLSDVLGEHRLEELIDFVCDEYAAPPAPDAEDLADWLHGYPPLLMAPEHVKERIRKIIAILRGDAARGSEHGNT